MNKTEEISIKLKKVNLAIEEINDKSFESLKQRKLILDILLKIKKEILFKYKKFK